MNLRTPANLVISTLVALSFSSLVACKSKAKKSNSPSPTPTQQPVTPTPTPAPNSGANANPNGPKVALAPQANQSLEFRESQTVRVPLVMQNAPAGTQYEFSLAKMPAGAQLLNRTGAAPEIVWNAATAGNYDVVVVARNMAACQQALGAQAAQCSIPVQQFGQVAIDNRFDITQSFQIKIVRGVGQNSGSVNQNGNFGSNVGGNFGGGYNNGGYNNGGNTGFFGGYNDGQDFGGGCGG